MNDDVEIEADDGFEITIKGVRFSASIVECSKGVMPTRVVVLADAQYSHQGSPDDPVGNAIIRRSDPVRIKAAADILAELVAGVKEADCYKGLQSQGAHMYNYAEDQTSCRIYIPPDSAESASPVPEVEKAQPLLEVICSGLQVLEGKYGPTMPPGASAIAPRESPLLPSASVVVSSAEAGISAEKAQRLEQQVNEDTLRIFRELEEQIPPDHQAAVRIAREKLMAAHNKVFDATLGRGNS